MKRPSFQFYPSDWLRDTALRTCSIEARGLWMDMLCYMHEGNPYGHLKVNQKVILPTNLALMAGLTLEATERCLNELLDAGVVQNLADGTMFSKRMVRDEDIRNRRAEGGKLGGNPELMKDNHKVNQKDNRNLTPSSSSSSSSSSSNKRKIIKEKFDKPLLEEVKAYCVERGNAVDPTAFIDFYTSKGWKIGKNSMKDWKAAVRTWEKNTDLALRRNGEDYHDWQVRIYKLNS